MGLSNNASKWMAADEDGKWICRYGIFYPRRMDGEFMEMQLFFLFFPNNPPSSPFPSLLQIPPSLQIVSALFPGDLFECWRKCLSSGQSSIKRVEWTRSFLQKMCGIEGSSLAKGQQYSSAVVVAAWHLRPFTISWS